jgi:hypothetical protein
MEGLERIVSEHRLFHDLGPSAETTASTSNPGFFRQISGSGRWITSHQ